ncbi:hypothetical protein B0H14DRAFT_2566576 [Mycena olivaceomarginata]|nr:hypothetical protein B0H14DRAFT_2566576 [Mycena olivaceomarginata]
MGEKPSTILRPSLIDLDTDTLVLRNFDELFDSSFNFAAVPNVWRRGNTQEFSLLFNAGVLAIRPSSGLRTECAQPVLRRHRPAPSVHLQYNANLAIKHRSPVWWKRLSEDIRVTLVKPFLHNEKIFLTAEELENFLDKNARREDGLFSGGGGVVENRVSDMMVEHEQALGRC